MIADKAQDPVLQLLAELDPPVQRMDRADRVRTRCHKAFARRRQRESHRRSVAAFGVDAACFVALIAYLVGVATEAIRLGLFGRV
jgi:hypothetical protein